MPTRPDEEKRLQDLVRLVAKFDVGRPFRVVGLGEDQFTVQQDAQGRAQALRIGSGTVYELVEPLPIDCDEVGPDTWVCRLAAGGLALEGHGATAADAQRSWVSSTHRHIQRALRARAAGEGKQEEWAVLTSVFDLERPALMDVRQAGRVVEQQTFGTAVAWAGYDPTPEVVPFSLAPPELAGFEVGECFEALARRNAESWRLLEVLSVALLPPPTRERRDDLLERLARAPSTHEMAREES